MLHGPLPQEGGKKLTATQLSRSDSRGHRVTSTAANMKWEMLEHSGQRHSLSAGRFTWPIVCMTWSTWRGPQCLSAVRFLFALPFSHPSVLWTGAAFSDRVSRDHYRAANIYLIFVHQVRHLTCVLPHLTLTSSLEVGVTITSISQIWKSRLRKVK